MRGIILIATFALLAATTVKAEDWAIDAHWKNPSDLARIAPLFQHLKVDRKHHTVSLIADDAQLAELGRLGIAYGVDMAKTANMRTFYAQAFERVRGSGIPGYSCYRTVEETYASMDQLAAAHPTLAQVIDIGPTWERTQNASAGYQMRVLRIGNSATDLAIPNKPNMVVFSSIHAREYAPAEVNTHFAEWLLDNYGSDPEATWLVDHENFHLILQANPDGRKKAESGLLWRKNTNTASASCGDDSGIDLNRNFPFHWGIVPGQGGSSTYICDQTYRGPSAMSEPETNALVAYVAGTCTDAGVCTGGVFPDLRDGPLHPTNVNGDGGDAAPSDYPGMFLDMHSYANLVLWSWGDRSSAAPNGPALQTFGRRLAWFNGYSPEQSDTLYPTDGTTDDSFYGSLGVPAYTFELDIEFFEPCAPLLAKTIPDNLAALRYAARSLHAPYLLPAGPDVTRIEASPDLVAAGTPIALTARIDDSQFNQSNGAEPIQNISSAQAFVDGLPWEGSLPVASLAAGDGAFDSPAEEVSASIASGALGSGRHLLFVQGTDASTQAGTPNAVFVDVAEASDIANLVGTITARGDATPLATNLRVTNTSTGESRSGRSSGIDGSYSRPMLAGTVDIHVDAPPGYLSEDVSGVSLTGANTTTRDIALFHACTVFADDVESGSNGWSSQPPWVRSQAATGNSSYVWATPNYGNDLDSSLLRTIDLTGYADSTLAFDDRCDTERNWDFGHVEYSVNNGSWTSLYQCSGRTSWQHNRIDLPSNTDNVGNLRLRFRLTSDSNTTRPGGWAIDNIVVESGGSQCRASQNDRIFDNGFEQEVVR
ncbi:MAG TPA: M14 family zinc carboxypeptidase [Dokdonella sp.]|uniref:M14 family zinc carboxypeptidase n=1 Tax=Dokdonella sp. TaxID=2291710 RepID=UPI002D7EAD8C|nr:M14 family zinc carboxypeptidase [Dokdonella sp.]HET9034333.1 M14 family zinc carboxypeptidase [Dokdonella sp.]